MFARVLSMLRILIPLVILSDVIHGNPLPAEDEGGKGPLTLQIVHTNDMHSRFEETSRLSAPICAEQDVADGNCYGGFARIATLVRQARNSSTPTIFLNAGDTYQGSVWYNVLKWKIVTKFLNVLAPDAISLGNHEFDDGVKGLIPFIENANFPILATNLDLSKEPALKATKLANSTVLKVNGTKIGVIGYLTPETVILSSTGNVVINDEIPAIREEAKKLKKQGVNILIALGHSGYNVDKEIAKEVEDIDIVIGGHTNTFLYRGKQPDVEHPEGFYPTEIIQDSGRKVYVVQAYAYTKYLGNFSVTFDSNGEITHIEGNPVLVNSSIKQAPDVIEELDRLRPMIDNISSTVIGKSRVLLDGDSKSCRRKECNLGNLITDAIIDYNAQEFTVKGAWTDAAIAVQNSGSIRASITRAVNDKITTGDVLGVLPFGNIIVKVSMTGEQLLSMLEWSVFNLNDTSSSNLYGAFLQFSGLQVLYDLSRPSYSRVVAVQVQCAACRIPSYSDLDRSATYKVLINDFMQSGGDGYKMLENLEYTRLAITTADAVIQYFQRHSPVHTGVEWRINYVDDTVLESVNQYQINDYNTSASKTVDKSMSLLVLLTVISKLLT